MIGKLLSGRYQVTEEIGKGGMATVYQALDTKLQRRVAVKIIHPGIAADPIFAERFRTEAQNAASLNHPHVVAVYDVGEDDGVRYIVLEFVEGKTLRDMLGDGPLPIDLALNYARQLAAGLAAAHRRGIIHCDIKPQNVLIADDGTAKLADFGISRAGAATGLVTGAMIVGTLDYLAPEQIEGRKPDERSDVYALGLVIYEMLSGRVPFERAATPAQSLALRITAEPKPLREANPAASPELESIVMRALQKAPAARYPSASSLADALAAGHRPYLQPTEAAVLHESPTVAVAVPAERSREKTPRSVRWLRRTLLALVGGSALVVMAAFWLFGIAGEDSALPGGDGAYAVSAGVRQFSNAAMRALLPPTPTPTPTETPTPTPTNTPTPTPTPVRVWNGTLVVGTAKPETLRFPLLYSGSTIEGYFTIQGGNNDISFRIQGPDGSYLIDVDRVRSRYEFRLPVRQDGTYVLIFDNTFSWFTNKMVTFSVRY